MEAFRVFDPYNEGFINEKEFTTALTTLGDKLSKEEVCCFARLCFDNIIFPVTIFTLFAVRTGVQGLFGGWASSIQGICKDDVC
jgi:hypothetical protein